MRVLQSGRGDNAHGTPATQRACARDHSRGVRAPLTRALRPAPLSHLLGQSLAGVASSCGFLLYRGVESAPRGGRQSHLEGIVAGTLFIGCGAVGCGAVNLDLLLAAVASPSISNSRSL